MSDELSARQAARPATAIATTTTTAKIATGPDAYGRPISTERQAELQGYLDRWQAQTRHDFLAGPFDKTSSTNGDRVKLTGADVSWLAKRTGRNARGRVPDLLLQGVDLSRAHLERADLRGAHLERANLSGAYLEGANVQEVHLEGADLRGAHLEGAQFSSSLRQLYRSEQQARLEVVNLSEAHLEGANLIAAQLQLANLEQAHLEGANLSGAHLEGRTYPPLDVDLRSTRDPIPDFPDTLAPARLVGAFLDTASNLTHLHMTSTTHSKWCRIGPSFADAHWATANLIVMEWEPVAKLEDEQIAEQAHDNHGKRKSRQIRIDEYRAAARAYRLLSVALRAQGLSTDATRFHYRAEVMDRKALFHRRTPGRWLFSWLLGTFAGYGDRLGRLFLTYAAVVLSFALTMLVAAVQVKANQPVSLGTIRDVLVLSVSSFHGRGIQPPGLHLDDLLATLAGAEAVFGLLIEGLFIAAFTRRVTGG